MSDFAKYLRNISEELKILSGDIERIIISKEKANKEEQKKPKDTEKKESAKKETAQDKFKKISLKSLQPVTKLYKDKKEIKEAKENPELDFINKRLQDIFSK